MSNKSLTIFVSVLISITGLVSCAKHSAERTNPPTVVTPAFNSSVRIIPLGFNSYDLIVNGQQLTNFQPGLLPGGDYNPAVSNPTLYFPANGKLSGKFTLTNGLFVNNKAKVIIGNISLFSQPAGGYKDSFVTVVDTVIDNGNVDVYIGNSTYYIVPRDVFPSPDPTNCKIRLINLFDKESNAAAPLTLTWSDGTPISPANSHLPFKSIGSYVEMPYTTCRLHLLDDDGMLVQEAGPTGDINDYYNTVDVLEYPALPQSSLIHTLQPGGIYTVVANPARSVFQLITDNNPVNNSFGRIEFVNAVAGFSPVEFRIDGNAVQSLGFGEHSDYAIYNRGPHQVSVVHNGKILVQQPITLQAGDALTLWASHDGNGYSLLYTNTDMSTSVNFNNQNNLSRTLNLPEALQVRFLNLCPDLPYATFTNGGKLLPPVLSYFARTLVSAPRSSENIPYGQILSDSPYVRVIAQADIPKSITVYAPANGNPEDLPGLPVPGVDGLQNPFLANPAIYGGQSPFGDFGIYSVALIGRATIDTSASEKARLIIIKHNK